MLNRYPYEVIKKMRAIVDALLSDYALLLIGDEFDEVFILRKYLPRHIYEGCRLLFKVEIEPEAKVKKYFLSKKDCENI